MRRPRLGTANLELDTTKGDERKRLAQQYRGHLDVLAERVKDVPEEEIDAAIDEAIDHARQNAG